MSGHFIFVNIFNLFKRADVYVKFHFKINYTTTSSCVYFGTPLYSCIFYRCFDVSAASFSVVDGCGLIFMLICF